VTVASALRNLPSQGDQPFADSVTQELAVLFESLSVMLARHVSAAASQAAISAGGAAAVMLASSPYKTLGSTSPSLTPHGGHTLKSTAEYSFQTISREVEVSEQRALLVVASLLLLLPVFCSQSSLGTPQICCSDVEEFERLRVVASAPSCSILECP
jgi:hypothetical protein